MHIQREAGSDSSLPGNHAQLPRDGKRVSKQRQVEELGRAMCGHRADSHKTPLPASAMQSPVNGTLRASLTY